METAHTVLLDPDEDKLDTIRKDYLELARKSREALRRGKKDTDVPAV